MANRQAHTIETIADIKRLFVDEGRTAAETARMLGLSSRLVVIGVAYRAKWKRSDETRRLNSLVGNGNLKRGAGTSRDRKAPKMIEVTPVAPTCEPVPFFRHERGSCVWIVSGAGYDALTCVGPVKEGAPYCEYHYRVAHRKPETAGEKRAGRL